MRMRDYYRHRGKRVGVHLEVLVVRLVEGVIGEEGRMHQALDGVEETEETGTGNGNEIEIANLVFLLRDEVISPRLRLRGVLEVVAAVDVHRVGQFRGLDHPRVVVPDTID